MTRPATPRVDAGALAEAVRDFTAQQSRHGLQAVALEVSEEDGRPLVSGTVLTQRQAAEVRNLARRHGVTARLVIAAEPRSGMEAGWMALAAPVVDVWREPSRAGVEMGRQTQYLRSDGPLRFFVEVGEYALVQGPDLAMGWASTADVERVDIPDGDHPWAHVVRAQENDSRRPAVADAGSARLLVAARAELGVPYIWGGTTHAGFDCSGLLQRVFLDTSGVLLPRHTADQRRVGARVVAGGVRPGDLLFATPRTQKVGHVMLMTSAATVLHACRTEHKVIEEPLVENALRYQHQGWRRPVWLGEVPE